MDSFGDTMTSMAGLLAAIAATPRIVPPLVLEPGTLVNDTFRIERQLGVGGMGVVYLAHDERLQRKVALKLHARLADELGTERMMREATAMAQLNHPNVLTIHEVGTMDGHVFIAMEYIDGCTLREWLGQDTRRWAELRPVLLAAGEGLAEAHAAGLVHRDFKPENVLIAASGRVAVADFGLARAAEDTSPAPAPRDTTPALGDSLTRTGAMMGTPAYMAPEQYESPVVDARADQFAYCVTVYEALYGCRPFEGATPAHMLERINENAPPAPPPKSKAPRWLFNVIARGLRADPKQRYPDMPALLAALRSDPDRIRRNRLIAIGTAVMVVAVIAGVWWAARHTTKPPADPCDGGEAQMAMVWNKDRAAHIHNQLSGSFVATNWRAISRTLDTYATTWVASFRNACEASRLKRNPPKYSQKRVACLADALSAFDGMLTAFENRKPLRVMLATSQLPVLEQCNDPKLVAHYRDPVADTSLRTMVKTLRRAMFQAKVLVLNGRYTAALDMLDKLEKDAAQLSNDSLLPLILTRKGQALMSLGKRDAATRSLKRAYRIARRIHDASTAGIAAALMLDVAASQGNWKLADQWADLARLELPNAGEHGPTAEVIYRQLARLRSAQGRYGDALSALRAALRITRSLDGDNHIRPAIVRIEIASALDAIGKRDQAKLEVNKALETLERLVGRDHPLVANGLRTLALIHNGAGEHKQAVKLAARALRIYRDAFGEQLAEVGYAYQDYGVALAGAGRTDDAIAAYDAALKILRRQLPPGHADIGQLLDNLGVAYEAKGQLDKAIRYHEHALRVLERQFGKGHYQVAVARANLGSTLANKRRFVEAARYFSTALEIFDDLAPNDPAIIVALNGLGVSLIETRHARQAVKPLERALALGDRVKADPSRRARTRLNLANALLAMDQQRKRAVTLMNAARQIYVQLGANYKHLRRYCERWLDRTAPGWRARRKAH